MSEPPHGEPVRPPTCLGAGPRRVLGPRARPRAGGSREPRARSACRGRRQRLAARRGLPDRGAPGAVLGRRGGHRRTGVADVHDRRDVVRAARGAVVGGGRRPRLVVARGGTRRPGPGAGSGCSRWPSPMPVAGGRRVGAVRCAVGLEDEVADARADRGLLPGPRWPLRTGWRSGHRLVAAPVAARGDAVVEACERLDTAGGYLSGGLTDDLDSLETGFRRLGAVLGEPGNERTVRATLTASSAGCPPTTAV